MIHMTEATKKIMELNYDEFGDSYTLDVTAESLQHIFQRMKENIPKMSQNDIREIEEEDFPNDSPYGLFGSCKVYIDNKVILSVPETVKKNDPLDLIEVELRCYGAEISNTLDSTVSHVMVHESDLTRLTPLKEKRHQRQKKFHIVTEKWMRACIENKNLCQERSFEPSCTG